MPSYLCKFPWLAAGFLAVAVSSARADNFSALYTFGDSLSDAGNAYIATGGTTPGAPYSNGRFSNGNVWVQDMAATLGLPAAAKPSLLGGTDYAVGGADSGNVNPGDLTSQLAAYKAANPVGSPTGLYMIWIGSNDLRDILAANPSSTVAAAQALAVVANIDNAITTLAGEGAKNFLVVTVPDLGKTPGSIATGAAGVAAASGLAAYFDTSLVGGVGAAGLPSLGALATAEGLKLSVLDTYSLIDGITANPAAFGFSDVTDACLQGAANYSGGTPCTNPNQYLFWDQIHPTAAAQSIVAQAALQAVPEPAALTMMLGGVAALALVVVKKRRGDLVD